MSTPSHLLKLDRAEKHLADLRALVGEVVRKPYPVRETFNTNGKKPRWIYTLDLDDIEPDEAFPIFLGDFLFNVRSALDHLIMSIAPTKRKYKAGFPIFTSDPLAIDQATGEYLDAEHSRKWGSLTKGLPDDCIARLVDLQPYVSARQFSKPTNDHPLAILSALHNADKHRDLVGVVTGLRQAEAVIEGVRVGVVVVLLNGHVLHVSPEQVQVEVEGSPVIGVGGGNEIRDWDAITDTILNFIANEVLSRLEPFVRG